MTHAEIIAMPAGKCHPSPPINGHASSFVGKKRPPQGILSQISSEQRSVLHRWFRDGLTYKEIARQCSVELGFKVSTASLCYYYKKHNAEIFELVARGSTQVQRPTGIVESVEFDVLLRVRIWADADIVNNATKTGTSP